MILPPKNLSPISPPSEAVKVRRSWAAEEFSGSKLGDKRLDDRLVELAEQFTNNVTSTIPEACSDWAGTNAAYRFFKNPKTKPKEIYSPHYQNTKARMSGHKLVLVLQDTTLLDYSTHLKTTGLGPIGTNSQKLQGLVMHSALAVVPTALPLGLLSQQIWARPIDPPSLTDQEKKNRPLEEKESFKWIKSLRESVANSPQEVKLVTVGDCEADVYELFVEANNLQTGLLIRAAQNRSLMPEEQGKVWDHLANTPVMGQFTVEVAAKKDQPARTATVSVQFASVTFKPPYRPKSEDPAVDALPAVELDAILVTELNPPPDVDEPLEWRLLTNQPVLSFEMAVQCIDWYCLRWHIETFHKVLKSGCKVEECRLSSADRLKPYLALQSIVAWRIFFITHINRTQPDQPCTCILAEHEWRALYAKSKKTSLPPKSVPSVRQAVRWMAQLGGFLGRKSDGEPGITVIWRGYKRLTDLADLWLLFYPNTYG